MQDGPEITEVRAAHRFDEAALERYLAEHVDGFHGPLKVRQFEGGQSNPTFLLETGGDTWVMRKKPPGELLPSAHQVDREYRVMHALEGSDVPVPKMICLCDNEYVIGTAFYVMEYVEGRIFTETELPSLTPDERHALHEDGARVLAALHGVDYEAVGLGEGFGRPGNYFTRQIGRWSKQYEASKTDDLPAMDKIIAWLPDNIPPGDETTIVHGDFRIGNLVVHPDEPKIVAVLDWELSTLGHPLGDLGYAANDGGDYRGVVPGIPSAEEYVDMYCRFAGRDPIENWFFYSAFNLFRTAAIVQGVYKRGLDGNASSEQALTYGERAREAAEKAWALVEANT